MIKAAKALDQDFVTQYNNKNVDGIMADYWNSSYLVESIHPAAWFVTAGTNCRNGLNKEHGRACPGAKLEWTDSNYMPEGDVVIGWEAAQHAPHPTCPRQWPEDIRKLSRTKTANGFSSWIYASMPMANNGPPATK